MAKKKSVTARSIDDGLGEVPVHLTGPSSALRGTLYLKNTGTSPVQVNNALLTFTAPSGNNKEGEKQQVVIPLSAYLKPGVVNRVKIKVNLSPYLPPNTYEGTLEFEGYKKPLIVHVIEVVDLQIAPDTLVVDSAPGSKAVKQVGLTNQGNTTLTIGPLGELPLAQEVMPQWRAQVTAGALEDGLEALFADATDEEHQPLLKPVGTLKVRNAQGPFELGPGEMQVMELEIQVPKELETDARYLAQVPLYTSNLRFVVVPSPKRG